MLTPWDVGTALPSRSATPAANANSRHMLRRRGATAVPPAGLRVAVLAGQMEIRWRERLAQLKEEWKRVRAEHPRIAIGVAGALGLAAVISVGGSIWFVVGLRSELPNDDAIGRIGVM